MPGADIKIPVEKKDLKKIAADPTAAAKAARLVYVNSSDEGIYRVRAGKNFKYLLKGKAVRDKPTLHRIKSLVLPPAWEDVWICTSGNGHLQATGKDTKGRKQYRYHPFWNELRSNTKFFRLRELGKLLPTIRKQVQKDLALPGLPKEKVLAVVVKLMEKTGIRTGNEVYEKLYGSFGVTTLKDQHTTIRGNKVRFCFRGKKGVEHTVTLKNKKLAKIIQQCKDIPGKALFQYFDEENKRHTIESGMVNAYIRDRAEGGDFTAKDFRTWCGSVAALSAFKKMGCSDDQKHSSKNINEMLDFVSGQLGNTRAVCKKYYVHPCLAEMYAEGKLDRYLKQIRTSPAEGTALSSEEKVFMKILEKAA